MVKVVENPVEVTFKEAIYKYQGYCLGLQVTDRNDRCIFKVKVLIYSDDIPDKEFMDLFEELHANKIMWANPDGMWFPTREELEG